jgi:hypothetical protein
MYQKFGHFYRKNKGSIWLLSWSLGLFYFGCGQVTPTGSDRFGIKQANNAGGCNNGVNPDSVPAASSSPAAIASASSPQGTSSQGTTSSSTSSGTAKSFAVAKPGYPTEMKDIHPLLDQSINGSRHAFKSVNGEASDHGVYVFDYPSSYVFRVSDQVIFKDFVRFVTWQKPQTQASGSTQAKHYQIKITGKVYAAKLKKVTENYTLTKEHPVNQRTDYEMPFYVYKPATLALGEDLLLSGEPYTVEVSAWSGSDMKNPGQKLETISTKVTERGEHGWVGEPQEGDDSAKGWRFEYIPYQPTIDQYPPLDFRFLTDHAIRCKEGKVYFKNNSTILLLPHTQDPNRLRATTTPHQNIQKASDIVNVECTKPESTLTEKPLALQKLFVSQCPLYDLFCKNPENVTLTPLKYVPFSWSSALSDTPHDSDITGIGLTFFYKNFKRPPGQVPMLPEDFNRVKFKISGDPTLYSLKDHLIGSVSGTGARNDFNNFNEDRFRFKLPEKHLRWHLIENSDSFIELSLDQKNLGKHSSKSSPKKVGIKYQGGKGAEARYSNQIFFLGTLNQAPDKPEFLMGDPYSQQKITKIQFKNGFENPVNEIDRINYPYNLSYPKDTYTAETQIDINTLNLSRKDFRVGRFSMLNGNWVIPVFDGPTTLFFKGTGGGFFSGTGLYSHAFIDEYLKSNNWSPTGAFLVSNSEILVTVEKRWAPLASDVLVFKSGSKVVESLSKTYATSFKKPAKVIKLGNDIYIADTDRHRILKNGKVIAGTTDQAGSDAKKLNYPRSFTISKKGELIIVDSSNYRVRLLEQTGNLSSFDWGDHYVAADKDDPIDITMGRSDDEFYVLTLNNLYRFRK